MDTFKELEQLENCKNRLLICSVFFLALVCGMVVANITKILSKLAENNSDLFFNVTDLAIATEACQDINASFTSAVNIDRVFFTACIDLNTFVSCHGLTGAFSFTCEDAIGPGSLCGCNIGFAVNQSVSIAVCTATSTIENNFTCIPEFNFKEFV